MSDFTAATWNVLNVTPPSVLRPILRDLRHRGVSVILLQEVKRPDVRAMFTDDGWGIFYHPDQYAIAYRLEDWTPISSHGVRLSETAYYAKNRTRPKYSEAVEGILCDPLGRTLTAVSYHTPPSVQTPSRRPARRFKALQESAASWRRTALEAKTHACLFGGDDNVDERHGTGWGFLLEKATGLKLVQAPAATHGASRRIDDFRTRGLVAGAGFVVDGGGDHRAHGRAFSWATS